MHRSDIHSLSVCRLAPRLHAALWHCLAAGVTLLVLLPAARGTNELIGWLPLWLLGMPLAAWWSLRRFPLPKLALRLPRRRRAQARRRRGRGVSAAAGVARRA